MSAVLNRQLVIGLGETQEKVGKIVSAEGAIEGIGALRVAENILVLAVAHELAAEFEVVIALGPRQVVTELVVVSGVVPGFKRRVITHVVVLAQKYGRHAVLRVATEEFLHSKSAGFLENARRAENDAVAVVVVRQLVQQCRVDRIGHVHYRAVTGVLELGPDRRVGVTAPQRGRRVLENGIVNEVAHHRDLVGDLVIHAEDLFAHIDRNARRT